MKVGLFFKGVRSTFFLLRTLPLLNRIFELLETHIYLYIDIKNIIGFIFLFILFTILTSLP